MKTLKEFIAAEYVMVSDATISERHMMPNPFKAKPYQWKGYGLVMVEFHTLNPAYGSICQRMDYTVTDYTDIKNLTKC